MLNSIVETVAHFAKTTPEVRCIAENDKVCTYGELWEDIQRFAFLLKKQGLRKGDRVMIHTTQTIMHVAVLLAVHLVGAITVPIEKRIATDRVREIMGQVGAKAIIVPKLLSVDCEQITFEQLINAQPNVDFTYDFPAADDLCDIMFTTGTTGKSKGVLRTHRNEMACGSSVAQYAGLGTGVAAVVPFPLNHSGGIGRLYACLISGAMIVPTDGVVFIQQFYNLIDKYNVTVMFLAPAHLAILLNRSAEQLATYDGRLKLITVGSAYLDESSRNRLVSLLPHVKILITYGATESSSACSFELSKYRNKPRCIGLPNANTRILITDEEGNELPEASQNAPGFIAHEGDTVTIGYWNEPELTASVLKKGRLITHDLGYIDEEGFIYILGRADDVIVTGGNKIAPFEVEDIVMELPGVLECAYIPVPDVIMGSVPRLYVVMKENSNFDSKKIMHYLQDKLEQFKLPRSIVQLDELPKTSGTNKLNRVALIKKAEEEQFAAVSK